MRYEINMEKKKKLQVQVLLSTYQGERFLKEQLFSIFAQEQVDINVLIRDDGSTDNTKHILNEFLNRYPEKIHIIFGENIGAVASYFKLLQMASKKADYIALSDQDDVWLPKKIYRAVMLLEKLLKKEKTKLPFLYTSAVQLVDEKLHFIPMGIHYRTVRPSFGNALVENMCTGCTCVMNQELLRVIQNKIPNYTVMHDFWIYLVAACFGTVIYDTTSYLWYRQHSGNEIGTATTIWDNYKRRIKNFKKNRTRLSKQAAEFLRLYEKEMPSEYRQLVRNFIAVKTSLKARYKIINNPNIYRQRKSDTLIMKILALFGLL